MSRSLVTVANLGNVNLLYDPDVIDGLRAPPLNADISADEALVRLLKGTGLSVVHADGDTVRVVNRQTGVRPAGIGATYTPAPIRVAEVSETLNVPNNPSSSASSEKDDGGGNDMAQVIVSAEKRNERLQDVPLSITAISSETLQMSGAQSLSDVARQVPGLNVVSNAPGQNQLVIRGVSSAGGVPTVGYYIDDTPIQSIGNVAGSAMDPALTDLERVEVLRGPQGTLYGSSSMGGTVRYITHQPDLNKTSAWVNSKLSDTDGDGFNYEFSGLINQPIVADVAAVRAIAFYRHQDGYIDQYPIDPNNYLGNLAGPAQKNVNTEKTYGTRVSVEIKPLDFLTITPSVFVQRTELGGAFTIDVPPGSFSNPIQARDTSEPNTDSMQLYTLTINGDFGDFHLTSSTSYRDRKFDAVEDDSKVVQYVLGEFVPGSYVYPSSFENLFNNHDFAEEIRVSGNFNRFHTLLGLFYLHQDNHNFYNWPITPGYNAAFGIPFDATEFFGGVDSNSIQQKASYGELTADLFKGLRATVGLRAFDVTHHDDAAYDGVLNGGPTVGVGETSESGVTPKYELMYQVADDALAYVSATKGFRQGGVLSGIPYATCAADLNALGLNASPTSYKDDTLWNYEIGGKTSWLDRSLTVNGSLYYIDWSNVQQLVSLPTCGYVFTGNFGSATSKGGELEVQYSPFRELLLSVGAAYNDAKLKSTIAGAQGSPGDTLENAPRWQGSASAEYRRFFSGGVSGYSRLDFSTTSYQLNNFDPTSVYYKRAGYSLLDGRVGLRFDHWDAALFADNLLNKYAETGLPTSYASDLPTTRRVALNRPRTVGLEVRWNLD